MNEILQILRNTVAFVEHIVGFITQFFIIAFKAFSYLIECIAFLPNYVKVAVMPIIALSIVLMVINRG